MTPSQATVNVIPQVLPSGTVDKRTATRALVLMAAVGFALVVYAFAVGPMAVPPPSGSNVPLRIWATTNLALYGAGEPVNVTVHVQNVGATAANLSVTSCDAFEFRVEDLQGTPYYDSKDGLHVCALLVREVRLAPGATVNETFPWNQTTTSGLPIPRGKLYRVIPLVNFPLVTVVASESALIYLA